MIGWRQITFGAGMIGLGAAAWLVFSNRSPLARRNLLAPGTRLLVLGDSYAVGLSPYLAKRAATAGIPFRGIGCNSGAKGGPACSSVVGSSVTQWADDAWLMPNIAAVHPTLVLVSLGGNDFQRSDPENVRASIAQLIAKVRAAGAEVVWINPLPLPFQDKLGVRQMWKATGVPYFDGEQYDYPRGPDRIHLYPAGYEDWSGAIWRWLGGDP